MMAKVMLAMGLVVAYGYLLENFTAWYSGHDAEMYAYANRFTGIYAPASWALMTLNVVIPQALWFRRVRQNIPAPFYHFDPDQYRYVAGAFYHRRHQPSSRLPARLLGSLRTYFLGLVNFLRNPGIILCTVVHLCPDPSRDLDF
jgi:hypothetical protein